MLAVGSLFAALEGGQSMSLILEVVDPGEVLNDVPLLMGEAVLGTVFQVFQKSRSFRRAFR